MTTCYKHRVHFVYGLFASDGECLYVGHTRSPDMRWKHHCRIRPYMVSQVAYKVMSGPYDYHTAYLLERNEQIVLRPRFGKLAVPTQNYRPMSSVLAANSWVADRRANCIHRGGAA